MSSWLIRKGTFNQPLSWRDWCINPLIGWPGLPTRLLEGGGGLRVMGPERRGRVLLHKHGAQSAGIALHSKGALGSGGLYFGDLALFNTITTAPFCPDLLALFICISRSLGCKVSSCKPCWMGKLIWGVVPTTDQGVCPQRKNVDLRKQHKEDA